MGWSCSKRAMLSYESMMEILKKIVPEPCSNVWVAKNERYMVETGREQPDGAITGVVHKDIKNKPGYVKRAGSIRIEANGEILRWPGSTKDQRVQAKAESDRKYDEFMELIRPKPKPLFEVIGSS